MFETIKALDSGNKIGYISVNTPATPLSLRVNAHFGRVFSFIEQTRRASAEKASVIRRVFDFRGRYGRI